MSHVLLQPAEPRFATPRNYDRRTLGAEVAAVMSALGTPPMPWQRQVLDVAYELDEDATEEASSAAGIWQPRLWYREPRVTVERQAGKTQKALARHTHRQQVSRKYGWNPRPTSIYMAQTATDARDKMVEEWFAILEGSIFDKADTADGGEVLAGLLELESGLVLVRQFLRANGREAVKWDGGGRIVTKPPSRKGGHGVSATALVDLDEAFAHVDASAEQGVRPSMLTSISPQIWIVSTAGTAESEFLWGKVDDGRARCETGRFGRVCYFEWSADPEVDDLSDSDTRCRIHPAYGYTVTREALDAEYDSMDLDEYLRAYGNVWTQSVKRLIPAAPWIQCRRDGAVSKLGTGHLYLAADAAPGMSGVRSSAIGIGGYNRDGKAQAEIIEVGSGMTWLPDRVAAICKRWPAIQRFYYDAHGPIAAVAPDIALKCPVKVEPVDGYEMAAACGRVYEAIIEGSFVHLGQPMLDAAAEGAAKRTLLDAWAWARRTSTTDISPLVVATLVHWGTVTHPAFDQRIV